MARPPGPSSSSGFESSIRGSAATAAASPQDAARATLAVARDAGVDLEPACSLRRQLLPCAVPSRRSFDGLDVADAASLTGPYDCPPSAYPGLATQAVPYAAVAGGLPGLRGTAGPAPGRGTVLDCSST